MKKALVITYLFIFFFLFMVTTSKSYGDSAEVLPKGVFRTNVTTNLYWPINKRFNPEGDTESVAIDFNTNLNSLVFPDLGLVEEFFGMTAGTASIGRSVVDFEYKFTDLIFDLQYGITDRLTAGVKIPYYWNKTNVKEARLDTSSATVGKNAFIDSFAPLNIPGTVPLTTEDVQQLLGRGLDINGDGIIDVPGFGFKRFESVSGSGLSDIEVGFRYQYLKTDNWRLAFTGGVRFPTGEVDDPDNLIDVGFGTGAYAALFRLNNDYTGIKNLVLNATFRYDLYFPDRIEKRVPDNVNQPITINKEKVSRKRGDIIELEASGQYEFLQGLNASLLYKYGFKQKDFVTGKKGFAYESLEEETNWTAHIFVAGLSYSTIPLFMSKKFPVPIEASVSYENDFAGSNNWYEQQFISLSLAVYF
jgi:hypothetical protein